MADWYLGSVQHAAITQWAASTVYNIGDIRRQLAAPGTDNERAFRVTTAGTSGGAEPTWTLTQGSTTNDNTVVWTEVTGNSTYGWGAAAARQKLYLNGGSSWAAAGDRIFRADNHAETQASSISYTSPGTAANPIKLVTVNPAAAPPTAISTGASVTTTGNNSITFAGFTFDYGINYVIGSGGTLAVNANFNASTANWWRIDTGEITLASSGTGLLVIGVNAANLDDRLVELYNTILDFQGAVASGISLNGKLKWFGGSLQGSAVTNLFTNVTTGPGAFFEGYGLDLTTLNAGESLFAVNHGQIGDIVFENCKLASGVAESSGSVAGPGGIKLRVINCDSADTNNNYYTIDYGGTVVEETTIVRTNDSRKIVTSANTKYFMPLVHDVIVFYNDVTTSQTVTLEMITDNITLTDADIWLEVEYLGTSGFPQSVFASNRISDPEFGTPANHNTSSVSWTTTGLTTPIKQFLDVTFTAEIAGPVKLRVHVARTSTTLYLDPLPTVS